MSSHLDALQVRLSNERNRLICAKTPRERDMRRVWVAQIEREIAHETSGRYFDAMTDDELLRELGQ